MNNKMAYQLYWEIQSGAMAPEMLLTELDADFENVPVDMANGEHRTPEYLAINPTGQVPAIRLPDGTVIGESAAILLAIGDRFPNSPLVPNASDSDRPTFLYWLIFMSASIYMTFVRFNHPERFTPDPAAEDGIRQVALEAIDRHFGVIENAIEGDQYFLKRGFTALDIYLTMLTVWYPDRENLFDRCPNIGSVANATICRPTCAKIMSTHLPLS